MDDVYEDNVIIYINIRWHPINETKYQNSPPLQQQLCLAR